jgi:hypothetical protein
LKKIDLGQWNHDQANRAKVFDKLQSLFWLKIKQQQYLFSQMIKLLNISLTNHIVLLIFSVYKYVFISKALWAYYLLNCISLTKLDEV